VSPPGTARAGAILLDIEGTTTPVSFVTQVLFPYARRRLKSHLADHAGAPVYESIVIGLRTEHASAARAGETVPPWADDPPPERLDAIVAYVEWLMDRDRKSTALKELQGRIWEDGYRLGDLVGEVFPDVGPALQRWHEHAVPVGIFSSGSVLAQQLLFRYSSSGDLARLLQWHFDTRVGTKLDPESYRRIAASASIPPENFLFLSDAITELNAAHSAGMQVRLVVRPGNVPVPPRHGHDTIRSFDELAIASDETLL
jgi:enolase-phosphatase E1